jgi:hypothetical protein
MEFTSFTQVDKLGLPKIDDPKWKALCRLLFRPYFFRVWIIQEILVARECIIQCGVYIVDRSVIFAITAATGKFHFISNMITANVPMGESVADNTSEDLTIENLRDIFSAPNNTPSIESFPAIGFSLLALWFLKSRIDANDPPTIMDLLMHTRMFKATQPCDKIFALVSLASDISLNFINYKKSPADVQIELARMCMRTQQSGDQCHSPLWIGNTILTSYLPGFQTGKRWSNAGPLCSYFLP